MRKTIITSLLWAAPLIFLALFYFYPLGSILQVSLARGTGQAEPAWQQLLHNAAVRRAIGFTFWQAGLSTLLTLALGIPGAYLIARYQFRGKSLLRALTGVPFVMPTLVVAAGFNALLGPKGWVNVALMAGLGLRDPPINFTNTLTAILVAHAFYNTTIVLRMVGDFWARIDPRLEQAARSLGASRWAVLRTVTLPLLAPAISAAGLLVFIFCFTSFGVILVLGGPGFATLEIEIYTQTISLFNLPLAAMLSLLQLACTLALTVVYTRLVARLTLPFKQRSQQATQRRLTHWRGRLASGLLVALLLGLTTTPLLALAARSVTSLESSRTPQGEVPLGLTTLFYRQLSAVDKQGSLFYVPPSRAIAISLGYAAATVILALALGLPAAWALTRNGNSRLNRLLDPLLMLPLGTSAVTLGLGFIVALDQPPLDLRTSPLLVPIAHTLVAFPFVIRSLTPALRSIQPRLRQAAALLGASPAEVIRQIDLPLIARALLVAATFAFTISLGEFGATALIARPEYPTIPVVIYRYLSRPGALNYGQAMALSTILMGVATAGMLAIERLRIGETQEF